MFLFLLIPKPLEGIYIAGPVDRDGGNWEEIFSRKLSVLQYECLKIGVLELKGIQYIIQKRYKYNK